MLIAVVEGDVCSAGRWGCGRSEDVPVASRGGERLLPRRDKSPTWSASHIPERSRGLDFVDARVVALRAP